MHANFIYFINPIYFIYSFDSTTFNALMDQPLISVVLCTYNGAPWLAEQIDSILAQSWRPLELVISDDASTDGTGEILQRYVSDPRVRIIFQEKNSGLTANFESAIKQTRGSLVAFSDQDDVWYPDKLEKLVAARGEHPLVYCDSLLTDEQGQGLGIKLSGLKKMYSGDDSRGYFLYSCVWGHNMLVTKDLLGHCLPMPPDVHYDIWIAFRAFQYGGIAYHNEVLTRYRQHTRSTSQTLPEKNSQRKRKTRYEQYREKLSWLNRMKEAERPEYSVFYNRLAELYAKKDKGSYVFGLLPFMLRHRKALFRYSPKGFFSQLVEILKQGRGERP